MSIANCNLVSIAMLIDSAMFRFRSSNYCPTSRASADRSLKASCRCQARPTRAGLQPERRAVPFRSTVVCRGFSASAPPPVKTIPRSTMSAESSGGVRSSATRTALIIVETESARASRISSSVDSNRLRNAFDQISTAYFERELFIQRKRRA